MDSIQTLLLFEGFPSNRLTIQKKKIIRQRGFVRKGVLISPSITQLIILPLKLKYVVNIFFLPKYM